MPDYSNLPANMFRRGDTLKADDLNKLADLARRSPLLPGSFQNSAVLLQAIGGQEAAAGTTLVAAIIFQEVPACDAALSGTYPDFTVSVNHGFTENACIVLEESESGWDAPELGEYDTVEFTAVANTSRSILRASETDPVVMFGYVRDMLVDGDSGEETVPTFVPTNWDMSSLFGFDAVPQIPYHDGDGAFKLDAGGCGS
jgi:hypothetical protein